MRTKRGKSPKHIFRLFIVPLVLIMLVQALISYGTVAFKGTFATLDAYSVSRLSQAVENRKIIFENSMTQQWSNIAEESTKANEKLHSLLTDQGADLARFQQDDKLQEQFMSQVLSDWLYMLRKNAVTGVFLILAKPDAQQGGELNGFYVRDTDPITNPGDYSDLLMERGKSSLSKQTSIPFASLWQPDFQFQASGQREADDFFFKPYQEAVKNPSMGQSNLSYWSRMFCLEDNRMHDSHRMITYSAPLIADDGTVYGIMGTEVSEKYLTSMLPFEEIDSDSQGTYLLLQKTADGAYRPVYSTGTVAAHAVSETASLELTPMKKEEEFYKLDNIDSYDRDLFATLKPLRVYNSNTPFVSEEWYLAGLEDEKALFGIGQELLWTFVGAVLLSLLVGLLGVYAIVRYVTNPIRRLSSCIRGSKGSQLLDFPYSHIAEVDELYTTIKNLSEQQKQAGYALQEEKERYRLALKGSSDILMTYDMAQDQAEFFNLNGQDEGHVIEHFLREVQEGDFIHADDRRILAARLQEAQEEVNVVFRSRLFREDGQYRWQELSGRVLRDADGSAPKLMGSLRGIHDQQVQQMQEAESMHRDLVTGLFNREAGEAIIHASVENGHIGGLILLDIEGFLSFNEQFGMAVGNSLLEEIGRLLLEWKASQITDDNRDMVAMRIGGDEFLIWVDGFDKIGMQALIRDITARAAALYPDASFQVILSAGAVADQEGGYAVMLQKAETALAYAKSLPGEKMAFYQDLSPAERAQRGGRSISQIARLSAERLNMVSTTFNFFDRSHDIRSIMAVLLPKLGRAYGAADIVLTQLDWDFNTVRIIYEWHEDKSRTGKSVLHLTAQECAALRETLQSTQHAVWKTASMDGLTRRFMQLPPDGEGLAISMYDGGVYMGAMAIVRPAQVPLWDEPTQDELQEIVQIMEANINRERYDLASRAKSDFLSRMSHEIRTPMNAIIGMTLIGMEKKEDPGAVQEALNKISQASQYLLQLINDILDMSKIESGKMVLGTVDFDLALMLDSVNDLMAPQMEEKSIRYTTDIRLRDRWVRGDSLHLNQVLINLLGNAVKFTPSGGSVVLTVKQEGGQYDFSVKDTGIGVSADNVERIFHSFEQADTGTAREYGGTGLGLAISSRLVRMMGGLIALDSKEGEGSDFHFAIPLPQGHPTEEAAPARLAEESTFAGRRVLLVEDNALNAEIAQTILEMKGFLVDLAENGQEALKRFAESTPGYYDLILMDIRMPVMDGLEATKRIRHLEREDAAGIPIIAMTANAFDEDMQKSVESGMNGHLAKPIDIDAFMKTLRMALGKLDHPPQT